METGVKKERGYFLEDLLFTHRGLSGPAILQISSFWEQGASLTLNLLPQIDVADTLIEGKTTLKKNLGNLLGQWLPARLADGLLKANGFDGTARIADMPDKQLRRWARRLTAGPSSRTARRATARLKSPWAASTRASCRSRA